MVAEEFRKIMAARGVTVSVQHIRDADPRDRSRTGWQTKVMAFADQIMSSAGIQPG
jgi:hypothetical protein